MGIQHFLHEHELKLHEKKHEDRVTCNGCKKRISSQCYGCSKCNFFLHGSCAELPQEIQHFFHPCPLLLNSSSSYFCKACYKGCSGFMYRCEECDFDMDVECSQIPRIKADGDEDQILHFSHPHPLTLLAKIEDSDAFCKICGEICFGTPTATCGCKRCKFYVHKSCMEVLPQKIQHLFHPCPLTLQTTQFQMCCGCDKFCKDLIFRCGKCRFHLCVKCFLVTSTKSYEPTDLPLTIQHYLHPCPLNLRISSTFTCKACYDNHMGFTYRCKQCHYDLDADCANLPAIASESGKEHIQHFSHPHPLAVSEKTDDFKSSCEICGKLCSDSNYGCSQCNFYLHQSCKDLLPQKIQHLFHQCTLIIQTFPSFHCQGCENVCYNLGFCCGKCHFHLCIKCSLLPTIEFDGHEKIQHYTHNHPLTLSDSEGDDKLCCNACEKCCVGPTYGCSKCNVYLHKGCMNILPQKVQHSFHDCPLILLTTVSHQCSACNKGISGLTFRCDKCEFELCIECSLLPRVQSEINERIQHFLHGHPLTLIDQKVVNDACCNACGEYCLGATYSCSRCNFFLHNSCAELPQQIQNFNHPPHPLVLSSMATRNSRKARCCFCLKKCFGLSFRCDKCDFLLDVECAFLMPTVMFMDHKHLLAVVENVYGELECKECRKSCIGSPAFRCLLCNFNLHLICGPLPSTIKHRCHVDPLTLKDFYVEEYDDDESDFICDSCEQLRDPRLCVYYCAGGCSFVCHVNCVVSEVIPSLRGERGDVELRTVGRHITSKVIRQNVFTRQMHEVNVDVTEAEVEIRAAASLFEIIMSFGDQERKESDEVFAKRADYSKSVEKTNTRRDHSMLENNYGDSFPYTEEAFRQFMESFFSDESDDGFEDSPLERYEFVAIGKNFVAREYIHAFEALVAKYGDIGAESTLCPKVKTLFLLSLCSAMHNMQRTVVADVTGNQLHDWMRRLKLAELAGFKNQFMFNHMERVARAHFGLQARKFIEDVPAEHDREIGRLRKKIQAQTERIEATKAKLQATKEEHEDYNAYLISAASTSFMKQCFSDALTLKWRPAAHGIVADVEKDDVLVEREC